jgi:hypothetical protein
MMLRFHSCNNSEAAVSFVQQFGSCFIDDACLTTFTLDQNKDIKFYVSFSLRSFGDFLNNFDDDPNNDASFDEWFDDNYRPHYDDDYHNHWDDYRRTSTSHFDYGYDADRRNAVRVAGIVVGVIFGAFFVLFVLTHPCNYAS